MLGGTNEASRLAAAFAAQHLDAVFSYAGVTKRPIQQPLPTRTGGFGGVPGLVEFLRSEKITHVVDATHPYAAQMSRNAVEACQATGVPLTALERPGWRSYPGWTHVPDVAAACDALPARKARVFLAIGKQQVGVFAAKPDNFYLLRMIDAQRVPQPLPDHVTVTGRGPFTLQGDRALMETHGITHLIAKNGGADAARAKLDAAEDLGLPVIMIDRPTIPARHTCTRVEDVLAWLGHTPASGTDRGV